LMAWHIRECAEPYSVACQGSNEKMAERKVRK
jgi:hypothetical protein